MGAQIGTHSLCQIKVSSGSGREALTFHTQAAYFTNPQAVNTRHSTDHATPSMEHLSVLDTHLNVMLCPHVQLSKPIQLWNLCCGVAGDCGTSTGKKAAKLDCISISVSRTTLDISMEK